MFCPFQFTVLHFSSIKCRGSNSQTAQLVTPAPIWAYSSQPLTFFLFIFISGCTLAATAAHRINGVESCQFTPAIRLARSPVDCLPKIARDDYAHFAHFALAVAAVFASIVSIFFFFAVLLAFWLMKQAMRKKNFHSRWCWCTVLQVVPLVIVVIGSQSVHLASVCGCRERQAVDGSIDYRVWHCCSHCAHSPELCFTSPVAAADSDRQQV